MKNFTTALVIVCSFSALAFSSCRKERANVIPPAGTLILGAWQVTSNAQDDNNNGSVDRNEIENFESERETVFKFYDNGKGILETKRDDSLMYSTPITWMLQNDDKELMIVANGPFTGKIERLDNNELVLLYENGAFDSQIKENFWLMLQKKP